MNQLQPLTLPISSSLSRNGLWVALSGCSALAVWPGLGDTIREPKWILLWIASLFFVPSYGNLKELPKALWILLPYFWIQPLFFAPFSYTYFYHFSLTAVLFLATFPLGRRISFRLFSNTLLAVTVVNIIYGISQLLGFDPLFASTQELKNPNAFVGFFGHHTLLGAWCAAMACFFLAQKRIIIFLLCSSAVSFTGSAFSAFSLIVGLLAICIWKGLWKKVLTATALLGILAFYLRDQPFFSSEGRILAWRMTISAWLERPLFGYGMDSYHREFHAYHQGARDRLWLQAHNEPLELLFSGGIFGFLLGLSLLLVLLWNYQNWWRIPGKLPWFLLFICVLGNSLGNFPYHIAPLALLSAISYFQLITKEKTEFF